MYNFWGKPPEKIHVRQFLDGGRGFQRKYLLSRRSRLEYEIEAYGWQSLYLSMSLDNQKCEKKMKDWAGNLASWRYGRLGKATDIYILINEKVRNLWS